MTFLEWAISAVTSGGVAALLFKAVFEQSLRRMVEIDIEKVRSDLRLSERRFAAELKASEDQLAALRSNVLTGMSARRTALDVRRLQAAEVLWSSVIELAPLKTAAHMTKPLKMDVIVKRAAEGPDAGEFKKLADIYWQACGLTDFRIPNAPDKERPFVSGLAWALFHAYRSLASHTMMQLGSARAGVDVMLENPEEVLTLAKAAMPEHADYISKYGTKSFAYLLDSLQEKLLKEIVASVEGADVDKAQMAQAAKILEAAQDADLSLKKADAHKQTSGTLSDEVEEAKSEEIEPPSKPT